MRCNAFIHLKTTAPMRLICKTYVPSAYIVVLIHVMHVKKYVYLWGRYRSCQSRMPIKTKCIGVIKRKSSLQGKHLVKQLRFQSFINYRVLKVLNYFTTLLSNLGFHSAAEQTNRKAYTFGNCLLHTSRNQSWQQKELEPVITHHTLPFDERLVTISLPKRSLFPDFPLLVFNLLLNTLANFLFEIFP